MAWLYFSEFRCQNCILEASRRDLMIRACPGHSAAVNTIPVEDLPPTGQELQSRGAAPVSWGAAREGSFQKRCLIREATQEPAPLLSLPLSQLTTRVLPLPQPCAFTWFRFDPSQHDPAPGIFFSWGICMRVLCMSSLAWSTRENFRLRCLSRCHRTCGRKRQLFCIFLARSVRDFKAVFSRPRSCGV